MFYHDAIANFANVVFLFSCTLYGAFLIHFHLLFPLPSHILKRFKRLPILFYSITILFSIFYSLAYLRAIYYSSEQNNSAFILLDRYCVSLITITYLLALGIAVYQFNTIKSTLARNQLRVVIIGSAIVVITPMTFALAYDYVTYLQARYPFLLDFSMGISGIVMIICLLIAIFQYRIWDVEIFIRKALLYLSATLFIIFTYLLMIWVVDRLIIRETDLSRFLILAVSVILFLVLRDRLQRMIDRFFHRELYDSATVVSDFEEKLAGIYRFDELKEKVVQSLDEIFHFKSFVFNLKTMVLCYDPVCVLGFDDQFIAGEFEGNTEFEQKLGKSKVFSPDELNLKPSILEKTHGELVVPLLTGGQPNGFFICGQKRSERAYSLQDIRVLSLLARRVTALFHTASLYQKDLDRQLMLERERARISQDMHDDIGAGLTRIAMMSEAQARMPVTGYRMPEKNGGAAVSGAETPNDELPAANLMQDRLNRIASTSREMISRLNVIVWALNPKYDTLDSLVAYSRRYFGEYTDNSGIRFKLEVPDFIPDLTITPDFRRNAFYAIQEAIHNAVKHGACSEIAVRMKIIQKTMEITITDNGKGFDQNTVSTGNGLLNMKKRAEDLGGSFEIQSLPSVGTRVLFNINLFQGNP